MATMSKSWKKKLAGVTPLLLVSSMLLAACGDAATATPPAATATTGSGAVEATATTGGGASDATATSGLAGAETPTIGTAEATATTGGAAGGTTPTTGTGGAAGGAMVPQGTANLTFWHGYTGAEADTLTKALQQLTTKSPDFKVNLLAVPFDQLKNKFTTEAATGGGPDVLIGPPDWIGELADAGLIVDLSTMDTLNTVTADLVPTSLDIAKYDGKQYGVTANLKNVALYYNSDIVKEVPKDTDALLSGANAMVAGNVKYGLALNTGFYNAVGYNFAFGGKLFTDPKTVDLTQQGTIDWLNWLKKAKDTPGVFAKAGADADIDNLFKTGVAGMVLNGPWALGDYQKALGKDKVKVAVAPSTPSGGKFAPFVGGDIYYINASSKDQKSALALIGYMMSSDVQQMFVDEAGQLSTNSKIDLSANPELQNFVEQSKQGTPFPNFPAMGKVWDPAGNMITEVMDGKTEAAAAAKAANDAINQAINSGQ
ncbi:MAG: extracellular solute-binding protein [Chloroflexota bacterium]